MNALWLKALKLKHGTEVILEWLGTGGVTVSKEEAQERANICLTCEHNTAGIPMTEAVAASVKKYLEVKSHLQLRVDGEKRLAACGICQCQLRLQVWQPSPKVAAEMTDDELRKIPDFCWKRKTITDITP